MVKTTLIAFKLFITSCLFSLIVNTTNAQSVSDTLNSFDKVLSKVSIGIKDKDDHIAVRLSPMLAWNNYDKTQVGLAVYTPEHAKYDFKVLAMYGTGSKNLTGIADFNYRIKVDSSSYIQLGAAGKRFTYLLFPEDLAYNKLQPSLWYKRKGKRANAKWEVGWKSKLIWQEYLLTKNSGRATSFFFVNEFVAAHEIEKGKVTVHTQGRIGYGKDWANVTGESKMQLKYKKEGNALKVKVFLGAFLANKPSNDILAPLPVFQLSGNANTGVHWLQKDYTFNELYLDRNAVDPFFRKQIVDVDGGFKSFTSLGNVNGLMGAVNVSSDVMLGKKVQNIFNVNPFLNVAYASSKSRKGELYAEGGWSILLFKEFLQFHFPLVTTNNIQQNQSSVFGIEKGEWYKRITFTLKLKEIRKHLNR